MLRNFASDRHGSFAVAAALIMVPLIAAILVGFDHARFAGLRSALPDAALQATIPAAQAMFHGTSDLKKLEAVAEAFLSTNLRQADPDDVDVKLTITKNPANGHFSGLTVKASVVYRPISGALADMFPAYSKDGKKWTATFPKDDKPAGN